MMGLFQRVFLTLALVEFSRTKIRTSSVFDPDPSLFESTTQEPPSPTLPTTPIAINLQSSQYSLLSHLAALSIATIATSARKQHRIHSPQEGCYPLRSTLA